MELRVKVKRNSKPLETYGWDEASLLEFLRTFTAEHGISLRQLKINFPEYDFSDIELIEEQP